MKKIHMKKNSHEKNSHEKKSCDNWIIKYQKEYKCGCNHDSDSDSDNDHKKKDDKHKYKKYKCKKCYSTSSDDDDDKDHGKKDKKYKKYCWSDSDGDDSDDDKKKNHDKKNKKHKKPKKPKKHIKSDSEDDSDKYYSNEDENGSNENASYENESEYDKKDNKKDNKKDKKDKKDKKSKCKSHVCTLIAVKNPDSELIIPEQISASTSATKSLVIGNTVDLTKWTDIVPDALDLFNNTTGTYTAPESGDYHIELVISFETSLPLPVSPLLNNIPSIELYDVATGEAILTKSFPTTHATVLIPPIGSGDAAFPEITVSSLLGKGQVIINVVIPLNEDQQIRFRAVTNGLVFNPFSILEVIPPFPPRIVFNPTGSDTTLTIFKIRNSPIVIVHCNN